MYRKAHWVSTARGTDPYTHISTPYMDLQSDLYGRRTKIWMNRYGTDTPSPSLQILVAAYVVGNAHASSSCARTLGARIVTHPSNGKSLEAPPILACSLWKPASRDACAPRDHQIRFGLHPSNRGGKTNALLLNTRLAATRPESQSSSISASLISGIPAPNCWAILLSTIASPG